MKHRKFRFSFVRPRAGGMATSHSWGDGQRAAKGQPKGSQRRRPIVRSVGRFLVLSFVASDKGGFCVPCAVLRASCAPGGPEQKQRRRRLARPERPRCPISALRQADGETVFSAASRPDAARARLARPRAATHAERAHKTRSVLSKKDRTAVFSFWLHKLLLPRRGRKSLQCPIREMIGRLLFLPGRGSFPVGVI